MCAGYKKRKGQNIYWKFYGKRKDVKGSIVDLILFYISKLSIGSVLWRGTRNMFHGCLVCFDEMKFRKWEKKLAQTPPTKSSLHLPTLTQNFRMKVPNRTGATRKFRVPCEPLFWKLKTVISRKFWVWPGSSEFPDFGVLSLNSILPEVPNSSRKFRRTQNTHNDSFC